jgi:uncharacterized protein YuzB (UPF0349 family)
MAIYYDMKARTHTYINGSYYHRPEPVMPELPVVNFGVDNTYCRRLIQNTLENIKMVDVNEYLCVCMCVSTILNMYSAVEESSNV